MSLLPERRALTRADLDAIPDDGHRYELIDGSLIVTPAPSLRHQAAVARLMQVLMAGCPDHLFVLTAPTDVNLGDDTTLQPDLVVVERRAVTEDDKHFRPQLVTEVLSPSTRHIDLTLKKSRFEAAGCPNYWVIDADEPSITAWTLTDGQYGTPTTVVGRESFETTVPFAVAFSPSQLLV